MQERGRYCGCSRKGFGQIPVFSPAMELELAAHIKRTESRLFGLTLSQLKRVEYDYAEANGIQHNFNRRTGEAGKDWFMTLWLATVTRFL